MPVRAPRPPVLLVAELPADPSSVAPAGWRPRTGFELPDSPWDLTSRRWLCVGEVDGAVAAEAAVAALSRGAGLLVRLDLDGDLRLGLLEDLHRAGTVTTLGPTASADGRGALDADQRALLEALASGATVAEAARRRHLSLRTANRRLADARRALDVGSTAEAVAAYVERR